MRKLSIAGLRKEALLNLTLAAGLMYINPDFYILSERPYFGFFSWKSFTPWICPLARMIRGSKKASLW